MKIKDLLEMLKVQPQDMEAVWVLATVPGVKSQSNGEASKKNRSRIWTEESDVFDSICGGISGGADEGVLPGIAASVAREGMVGFEIGCYTGSTACRVLPVFKENKGTYHCLDWFRGSIDTRVGIYDWELGNFDSPRVLIQTLKNFELMGFRDVVTLTIAQGEQIAPMVRDGIADYIYIGADHRYSSFKADLQSWLPKLRPGGVICGHAFTGDCEPGSDAWNYLCGEPEQDHYAEKYDNKYNLHFGVTRALHELLPGFQHEDQIWWHRKEKE